MCFGPSTYRTPPVTEASKRPATAKARRVTIELPAGPKKIHTHAANIGDVKAHGQDLPMFMVRFKGKLYYADSFKATEGVGGDFVFRAVNGSAKPLKGGQVAWLETKEPMTLTVQAGYAEPILEKSVPA